MIQKTFIIIAILALIGTVFCLVSNELSVHHVAIWSSDDTSGSTEDADLAPTSQNQKVGANEIHPGTTPRIGGQNEKQYVIMAFDGSRSIKMWEDTRAFAREMTASGTPTKFTYFINAVYLLDPAHYNLYQAPHEKVGDSNIGFGDSVKDVQNRISEINQAVAEGNEIGSHNAGHFDGSHWSYDEWQSQFNLFNSIVYEGSKINPLYQLYLKPGDIVGFRAPELGINKNMFAALKDQKFLYDCSTVAIGNMWPVKNIEGLWEFPLGTLKVGPHQKNVAAMDYNLYSTQTNVQSVARKGSALWNYLFKETYDAYMNYFTTNYSSNRAPVFIANHFSTWNDSLYWEVTKAVARDVCGKKDVVCGTYKDLVGYLETTK